MVAPQAALEVLRILTLTAGDTAESGALRHLSSRSRLPSGAAGLEEPLGNGAGEAAEGEGGQQWYSTRPAHPRAPTALQRNL